MIRLFHHYVHRRILLQMLFDFGLIVSTVVAVILVHGEDPRILLPIMATQGLSLATGIFLINTASGFYQQAHNRSLTQSCARAALASLFALPLAYAIFRLLPVDSDAANAVAIAAMLGVAAVIVNRVHSAHSVGRTRTRMRILILGSGPAAALVAQTIRAADSHAEIVGYVRGPNEDQLAVPASQLIEGGEPLAVTARRSNANEIVVALTERRGGSMSLRDLLDCRIQGIQVSDINAHFEKMLGQIRLDYLKAGWLIFGDGFDQGVLRTTIKRLFDLFGSLVLLVAAAPIMLATMVAIRLDSPGPALYRQQRVGLNGRTFNVIKFRSMRADAERDGKPRWASSSDDRITRVGRVIRLVRIDELPQLFNVLMGEMSLVGPRPERPYFVDQLAQEMPYYAVRHSVKPGVTGWAQVRYHYGSTVEDSQQKLQYDLYYVKNHTLFLDLLILFETVAVVLTGKGAR